MAWLELLTQYPWLALATAVVIGLCIGSFLNVVIYRLPLMLEKAWRSEAESVLAETRADLPELSIALPRSHCPHCGHTLGMLENIPLISYLFLRGRCSHCKAGISLRYPSIELLTGALSVAVVWHFGATAVALGFLLFVWALVALTFIDIDTHLLPDSITLPLVWAGILFNLLTGYVSLEASVIGAMAGYLSLWSVYWLFKIVTGKEGMGFGDFKLLAAIGAFLGWKVLPVVIFLSSIVGAVLGLGLIALAKKGRNNPIPFGPYLAIAGILALFFGDLLTRIFIPL